jgi:hypothetical protein
MAIGSLLICLFLLDILPDPQKPHRYYNSDTSTEAPRIGKMRARPATSPEVPLQLPTVSGFISVLHHRRILLTIPVFLVGIFRYTTLNILIQYASIRFKIKISQGAIFYTETAIVNVFLFLFLVPQLTGYIRQKYNVRPQAIDLFLVRTCVCLMSLGSLLIGISPMSQMLPLG